MSQLSRAEFQSKDKSIAKNLKYCSNSRNKTQSGYFNVYSSDGPADRNSIRLPTPASDKSKVVLELLGWTDFLRYSIYESFRTFWMLNIVSCFDTGSLIIFSV